jgi:hypothetical protein
MKELLTSLLAWWQDPSLPRPPFAEGFEMVGTSELVNAESWLFLVSQKLPWEDVKVFGILSEQHLGAVMVEGTDPITLLRHRVAWLVESRDGAITRLVETGSIVEAGGGAR